MSDKNNKFAQFQNDKLTANASKSVKGGRPEGPDQVECIILGGIWRGFYCQL